MPPVVETPHVEDSETGTENEKETESEIELVYSEGLIFHKNGDGTYKITSIGTCTDTELVIPPTYEGLPVTAIGDSAFSDCTHLSAVVIPATVTAIGDMAFNGCASLVSVTIPESVITIGAGAFSHCTVLTSVTVPDGIRSIGFSAFEDCPNLQFNVFDKANYLGNEKNPYVALVRCPTRGASSCKVHEDTQLIAEEAFLNCEYLTSITIPDGINFIGARAFNGCSKLVYNTYSNAQYLGNEGNPYLVLVRATERNITSCEIHEATKLIGCHAFINCSKIWKISIPESVIFLGENAFNHCSSLTAVVIPDGVDEIRNETFYYCKELASVTLPNGVTRIGDKAFEECAFRSITLPEGLTHIGQDAFMGSGLNSIVIPDSVISIGEEAFKDCGSLTSITLPEKLTVIQPYTFDHCSSLASIAIPDGVAEIGDRAFYFCLSLKSVTLPTGLMRIDYGAFEYCTTLTSAVFHEGLTSIGERVFYDCNNLTSITIPKSVTSIGATPFGIGEKLLDIYYAGSEEAWNNIVKDDQEGVFIPPKTTLHFNSVP